MCVMRDCGGAIRWGATTRRHAVEGCVVLMVEDRGVSRRAAGDLQWARLSVAHTVEVADACMKAARAQQLAKATCA